MSQIKAIVETIEIPIDKIKPSPYQPRIAFNLEDIRGSIQRDGILIPLTVRKINGDFELVDGERRTRLAKELGYKTVPVTVIDVDDATARRMVWKVNTLRQDYSPKEKAFYFKKLQEPPFGMSITGMARETDMGSNDVKAYLNVLKLPEDYQEMVWDRVIPIRNIRELGQLFNGVTRVTPEKNPELFELLDRSAKEKHFGAEQIRESMKTYLGKLRAEQVKKASEVIEQIAPEVAVPETPEQFEEAARVLRREARKRKSPKQVREEKRKKVERVLLEGGNSVTAKIYRAKELGIDTNLMEEEKERIEDKMPHQPDDALKEAKSLKNKINGAITDFQQKQREAELRKKVEKEFKEKKKEELKEELRKDETFQEEIRTQLMKDIEAPPKMEPLPIEIPEEEAKILRQRIEEQRQKMAGWLKDPEIQKRGALFKNWVAHGAMLDVLNSAFCPHDGPEKSSWKDLKWSCCGLSVEEAYDELLKKLEKGR